MENQLKMKAIMENLNEELRMEAGFVADEVKPKMERKLAEAKVSTKVYGILLEAVRNARKYVGGNITEGFVYSVDQEIWKASEGMMSASCNKRGRKVVRVLNEWDGRIFTFSQYDAMLLEKELEKLLGQSETEAERTEKALENIDGLAASYARIDKAISDAVEAYLNNRKEYYELPYEFRRHVDIKQVVFNGRA